MTLTAPDEESTGADVPSYAGLATRTLAFAADALIINAVILFVAVVVALGLSLIGVPKDIREVLGVIGAVIAVAWTFGYFVFFWSANGQTPGNRMLGISVRTATGTDPPSTKRSILRLLALPLSAIPLCAGFLMILVDRDRRALHDRLVRTVVIDTPARKITENRRPG